MAIFPAKFISGTSLEFHSRILLIPWVKKNFIRSCSKSSSFPVRYVPKKSLRTNELQTSSPPIKAFENRKTNPRSRHYEDEKMSKQVERNARLTPQWSSEDKMRRPPNLNSSRVEVLDVERSFGGGGISKDLSEMGDEEQSPNNYSTVRAKSNMVEENNLKGGVEYEFMEEPTEAVEDLEIHHTEDAHDQFAFEVDKTRQEAEKVAVQMLGARAFTAVKLKKKLLAEKFPPDIVDAVIADFRSRGFINDSLYAETFSRSRWSSSSWGPRRIKKALSEKGVNKADAEEAVKLVFEDGEAGDNQVSSLGFSKLSMDRLLSQASKQWLRGQDVPIEKRNARIIRWLQYRGFDWGVVSYVLKKLKSQNPP